ncbi:hypothetical protein I317_06093 [Kwoniella heveanensis CBS 569]|nr:hypothetical protein I317_06093 [Kwoniella heveanensis CBS 569]
MSDIQDITIISTKTVEQPKVHTVYVIQISTPTRTWTVQRRYSDFVSLHAELKSSVGKEPPGTLPAKHWSLTGRLGDEKMIRERRVVLEQYLRLILTSKDASWRQAYGFKDFLSLPTTSSSTGPSISSGSYPGPQTFTVQSWLLEHTALQSILRSARSSLLKRDALANMGDSVGSRSASVEAKRTLKDIDVRINVLESELAGLNLGEGEKKRREEMVDSLKVERSGLGRMAEAGVRTNLGLGPSSAGFNRSQGPSSSSGFSSTASSAFAPPQGGHSSAGGSMNSIPGGWGSGPNSAIQSGRVFGSSTAARNQPPEETAETRPLDDRGLLQLQATKMTDQDDQLRELSKVLLRQKKMGEDIHGELAEQNDLLDEIESGVDKTGRKLGKAKRELNKLG